MKKIHPRLTAGLALGIGLVAVLIGLAPNVVEEENSATPVDCGATLFHFGARPSPLCYAQPDPWRLASEVGLAVARGWIGMTIVLGSLRRRQRDR